MRLSGRKRGLEGFRMRVEDPAIATWQIGPLDNIFDNSK